MSRHYPTTRMRRMRRHDFSRRLMREHQLSTSDLIYPVFVIEGEGETEAVASMPGIERMTIDKLVDDESETVRRSVANHLNDISKDHPSVAVEIAATWLKKRTKEREKAVKHALRTLIKKGDPAVMALYGYGKPEAKVKVAVKPARLKIGETAKIEVEIQSTAKKEQKLLIDYIVHFRKASGKLSPKVFKWTEKVAPAGGSIHLTKQQPFRDVSTRKHYAGEQVVEVQVNGQVLAKKRIQLEA